MRSAETKSVFRGRGAGRGQGQVHSSRGLLRVSVPTPTGDRPGTIKDGSAGGGKGGHRRNHPRVPWKMRLDRGATLAS